MLKLWRNLVDLWRFARSNVRHAGRLGRIFGLRDRGRLEQALQEALALAAEVRASADPQSDIVGVVMAAAVIDELAERLDRPDVAYDSLVHAIDVIDRAKSDFVPSIRRKPQDFDSLFGSYRDHFTARLNLIVSLRNV